MSFLDMFDDSIDWGQFSDWTTPLTDEEIQGFFPTPDYYAPTVADYYPYQPPDYSAAGFGNDFQTAWEEMYGTDFAQQSRVLQQDIFSDTLDPESRAIIDAFSVDPATKQLYFHDEAVTHGNADAVLAQLGTSGGAIGQAAKQAAAQAAKEPDKKGGILDTVNEFLKSPLGKIVGMLGLGAVGVGMGQLVAGSPGTFTLPPGAQPLPAQQAAQEALTRAVTESGTDNLYSLLRSGVVGQRTLADLLAASAGRELMTEAEQAPAERGIRLQALSQIPGYLSPPLGATTAGATMTPAGPTLAAAAPTYSPVQGQPNVFAGPGGALYTYDAVTGGLTPQAGTGTPATGPAGPPSGPSLSATAPGPGSEYYPVNPATLYDPIEEGLRKELMRSFQGQFANPELERQLAEQERILRKSLYDQLGPGYELSTPGIQALATERARHNELREKDRRQTISAYAPLQQSRQQFSLAFPETLRRTGLQESQSLMTTGRRTAPELSTTLNTLVPISPLLGIESTAAADRARANLETDLAFKNFQSQETARSNLAASISGLFGLAGSKALGGVA